MTNSSRARRLRDLDHCNFLSGAHNASRPYCRWMDGALEAVAVIASPFFYPVVGANHLVSGGSAAFVAPEARVFFADTLHYRTQ